VNKSDTVWLRLSPGIRDFLTSGMVYRILLTIFIHYYLILLKKLFLIKIY